MSIQTTTAVWNHSRHDGVPLLVLLAIADHVNTEGLAWPSMSTLAKKARITERHAYRVVEQLLQSGELEKKPGGGRGRRNHYRILVGNTDRSVRVTRKGNPDRTVRKTLTPRSVHRSTVSEPLFGSYGTGAGHRQEIPQNGADRGQAAVIVREVWWQDKRPPIPNWTMGQEYSALDPVAKRVGWEIVLAAVRLVPSVFETNGEPFTGRLVFSRKTRDLWNRCLDLAERELHSARNGAPVTPSEGSLAEVLEDGGA